MWHMNSRAGFWTSMSAIDSDTAQMRTSKELGITVAVNGQRFYMDWDKDVAEAWEEYEVRDLAIHYGCRHGHMNFGGEWPHLPMPEGTWFICDDAAYQTIVEKLAFDPMDGWGYTADTLDELAQKTGMPEGVLPVTVERWNECWRQRRGRLLPPSRLHAEPHRRRPLLRAVLRPHHAQHRRRPAPQRQGRGPRPRRPSPSRTSMPPASSAACGPTCIRAPATWASAWPLAASRCATAWASPRLRARGFSSGSWGRRAQGRNPGPAAFLFVERVLGWPIIGRRLNRQCRCGRRGGGCAAG